MASAAVTFQLPLMQPEQAGWDRWAALAMAIALAVALAGPTRSAAALLGKLVAGGRERRGQQAGGGRQEIPRGTGHARRRHASSRMWPPRSAASSPAGASADDLACAPLQRSDGAPGAKAAPPLLRRSDQAAAEVDALTAQADALAPLYAPIGQTLVLAVKVQHHNTDAAPGVAAASTGAAGGGEGRARDAGGAPQLVAGSSSPLAPAGGLAYGLAAQRVREIASAAAEEAAAASGLRVLRTSCCAFPGCVQAVLALMVQQQAAVGAGAAGLGLADDVAQRVAAQLRLQLPGGVQAQLLGQEHEGLAADLRGVYLQPVAVELGLAAAQPQAQQRGHSVVLAVPPALLARLAASDGGAALPGQGPPPRLRAVVVQDGRVTPLLDQQWTLQQVPASGRLELALPPREQCPCLMHVLLLWGSAVLMQLPLLALPGAACADVLRLYGAMCEELGSPAAAYRQHLAPLARDLGALLELRRGPPPTGADQLVGAHLGAFLSRRGLAAAGQLVAEAAGPLLPPAQEEPAVAAGGAGGSSTAGALRRRAAGEPGPRAATGAGGSVAASKASLAPPSRLAPRHVLRGFDDPALEASFIAYKARALRGVDAAFFAVKSVKDAISLAKALVPLLRVPGATPLFAVFTAILVLGSVPYAAVLAAPGRCSAWREQLLLATRAGAALLAASTAMAPALRATAAACMRGLYSRPVGTLFWAFAVLPGCQQPTLRFQLYVSGFEMLQAFVTLMHIHAASGTPCGLGGLATTVAGCEVAACGLVAALDVRLRRRFLRAQSALGGTAWRL